MSATATRAAQSPTTDSPYVGLRSYGVEDADVFFGRDAEIEIITGNLCAARLTVLYADSGAGKSSVLRAGVTAALLEEAERDRERHQSALRIPVMFASWRDDPLADLRAAIAQAVAPFLPEHHDGESAAAPPTSGSESAELSLADMLAGVTATLGGQLLIMLDQLEEYLLYRSLGRDGDVLADELARCINRRELGVNFLISIREDAYAALGELFRGRLNNVHANTLHLEHLARDAAREAIERPLAHHNKLHPGEPGVEIEEALVETVLGEVRTGQVLLENAAQGLVSGDRGAAGADESIETPYMQLVMTRLWECERARGSRLLRAATLRELGGSQTIVRTHLTRALGELEPRELATATEVFLHLVTPSGAKIAQSIADLSAWSGEPPELVRALVAKLAASDQRIVRPLPPAVGSDSPRVEIFHDVLAKAIVDWCQRQTERRLRNERNAARRRTALVSALALVALALAVLAYVLREHQIHETHLALSRTLASQSGAQLERDPVLASLLALEGYALGETDEARQALNNALQQPLQSVLTIGGPVVGVAYADGGRALVTASSDGGFALWNPRTGASVARARLNGPVGAFAASSDGRLIAIGDERGGLAIWNVSRAQPAKIEEIAPAQWGCETKCSVASVAFSPRDDLLAFGDQGGEAILWSLSRRSRVRRLLQTGAKVAAIAFDPSGDVLAAGSASGEVRRWAIGHGITPRPTLWDEAGVLSIAVANSGTVATGDQEGSVFVWVPGEPERSLDGLDGTPVRSVSFSPDGQLLACANEAGQLSIYSTSNLAQHVEQPLYIGGEALALAFAPGGETLATGTVTGRVLIWNAHSPARSEPAVADGDETVTSVAFSSGGRTIVTSDHRGWVKRWNAKTRERERAWRVPDGGEALGAAISRDGRFLVAGDKSAATVVIWPLEGGPRRELKAGGELTSVAVSPQGIVAAGSANGLVSRWQIATGARVGKPLDAGSPVTSLAFSADGSKIAAGTEGGNVTLWDARTDMPLRSLANGSPITSVAFNPAPGSEMLASANRAQEVLIWSLRDFQRVGLPLTDHYPIYSVAYSHDGRILAAGDRAGEVLLSDARTGVMLGRIQGDGQSVESLTFNPRGTLLAAAGGSGEVSVYSPTYAAGSLSKLTAEVCARVHVNLTLAEWARYVPGESYRRLCPAPS